MIRYPLDNTQVFNFVIRNLNLNDPKMMTYNYNELNFTIHGHLAFRNIYKRMKTIIHLEI